ncbi:radical SAM protein [Streptomyces sp. NPDC059371]|uniref:radical SAM protein n=1 Tax=Streptomyces sp. NPDC059371 TaxID=3346812 RepID=UPI0036BC4FEC
MSAALSTEPSGGVEPHDGAKVVLPLTVGGSSGLAVLSATGERVRCHRVVPVQGGRFVHGSDNGVFGRWNALLAVSPAASSRMIRAHGGEFIPGRLDDHVERLRAVARGEKRGPVQVDFDVSMACPSACSFCFSAPYRATRKDGRLLDGDLLLALIRQWAGEGVRVVRFDGGGDPLTHPRLPEALSLCARLGMDTAVLTAGDLLSEALVPVLLAARTYLRVSLNAASEETRRLLHGRQSGGARLASILRVVDLLVRRRAQEWGPAAAVEMPLGATSMIHPANVGEVAALACLVRDIGFDHLSFRVVLGQDHKVMFSSEQAESLKAQFAEIRRTVVNESFQVFLPTRDLTDTGYVPSRYFTVCRASTHRAVVEVGSTPDRAAVVPCGRYRGEGFRSSQPGRHRVVFGELDGTDSLAGLHASPGSRQLLAEFPQRCGDCIDRSMNTALEDIAGFLQQSPGALFHPFDADAPGDDARA